MNTVIDGYLGSLGARLHGPRAAKRDLLVEARDGLEDAAAAYTDAGYPEPEAQSRAVADFGDVPVIAREFQAELAVAGAVRALWTMILGLTATHLMWEVARGVWWGSWSQLHTPTPHWYVVIAWVYDAVWQGVLPGFALLALVGTRFAGRRAGTVRVMRWLRVFLAVAVSVLVATQALLLGATGIIDAARLMLSVPCVAVVAISVALTAWLVVLARRLSASCVTIVA